MGQFRRPEEKVTETVTAVREYDALSIDLPEHATLADVAERVIEHGAGRRPHSVAVTLVEPAPLTQHPTASVSIYAERVIAHGAGRRPLYVTVTPVQPAPLHH